MLSKKIILNSVKRKIWGEDINNIHRDELYAELKYINPRVNALECAAREIYDRGVEGSIAEAGVYRGDFAKYMNAFFPERKLYLIDTFSSFDESELSMDRDKKYSSVDYDFSSTSTQIVLSKMKYSQNCVIKKGLFPESMEGVEDSYCFVSLDMDLYKPMYEGLLFFYEHLNKGGYIFAHDCRNNEYKGARQALLDFCLQADVGYVILPDLCGTAVLTK